MVIAPVGVPSFLAIGRVETSDDSIVSALAVDVGANERAFIARGEVLGTAGSMPSTLGIGRINADTGELEFESEDSALMAKIEGRNAIEVFSGGAPGIWLAALKLEFCDL